MNHLAPTTNETSKTTCSVSIEDYLLNRSKEQSTLRVPFALQLHEMLVAVERDGRSDIVSFQPDGRCFRIHKPEAFLSDILPTYFPNMHRIKSLQKQLKLYNFT
jgi:hypothetical protein